MARRVDLFVFDLAGTVVVDDDHVLRSFLRAAAAFDLEVEPAALQPRMGWHKERVFATLLEEDGRDPSPAPAMAQRFEIEFAALVEREPLRPTAGALATLATLDEAGVQIAFNTGFSRKTMDIVLASMSFGRWPSVASDEVDAGRPAPDLLRAAMAKCGVTDPLRVGCAGDTPADLLAGKAAGLALIVGLGCGTHTLDELRPHPHTHLMPDLCGLPEVVLQDG
jgi:phosphonatase-like hydrolase